MRNKPIVNFLGVGAQKSGTTALYYFLNQHPDIFIPKSKECHFFDKDINFPNNIPQYLPYHQKFTTRKTYQIAGEITPAYMFFPKCSQRISNYNPNIRLIIILRDPAERMYSQWNMYKRKVLGETNITFSKVIEEQVRWLRLNKPITHMDRPVRLFLERSLYSKQINNMLHYFTYNQMLFLKTEDLRNNQEQTLNKICDFLGIAHYKCLPKNELIHSHKHEVEPLHHQDRQNLINIFKPSIYELEEITGWNCSNWLQ